MNFRADAEYVLISNAEPLSEEAMDKAVESFRGALGPDDRAHGRPDLLVVTASVSAESEVEARGLAAERLQDALDAADLYGTLRTQRLDITPD